MIQIIPRLLSFTIFCIVFCNFALLSRLILFILSSIPSLISCRTVLPKIFVSKIKLKDKNNKNLLTYLRETFQNDFKFPTYNEWITFEEGCELPDEWEGVIVAAPQILPAALVPVEDAARGEPLVSNPTSQV